MSSLIFPELFWFESFANILRIFVQSIPTYSVESIADITDFYKGILD